VRSDLVVDERPRAVPEPTNHESSLVYQMAPCALCGDQILYPLDRAREPVAGRDWWHMRDGSSLCERS
jgi:hypothetical protein